MRKMPGSACVMLAWVAAAQAAEVGFTQDFNVDLGGFGGGSQSYVLMTDGGVGGAGDGWLEVSNPDFPQQLATRTDVPEFTGNLLADGVTGFSFWLRDTGQDDPLEMHVGVGIDLANFWIYQPVIMPVEDAWTEYTVDFSNPSDWVQTHGSGTFEDALANSTRLLFRHDVEPIFVFPDPIQGDFGIDRITVLPEPASLLMLAFGTLAARRRRTATARVKGTDCGTTDRSMMTAESIHS